METSGTLLKPTTGVSGKARIELPSHLDQITHPHLSYQLVIRFNRERRDPDYKPFQTPKLEIYALAPCPPG